MSNTKKILVRNHRKRSYNGIRYMQITEIPEHYLTQYISAWFMKFSPEQKATLNENNWVQTPKNKIQGIEQAKLYLEEHNIKYAKNMKDKNIIKRALDNWWKSESLSPKIDESDLSLLDEEDDENESELDQLEE